jgi:hypothetical protein
LSRLTRRSAHFSPLGRGRFAPGEAGDFTDKLLHIINASLKGLRQTGTLALPGHPASIRGPAF